MGCLYPSTDVQSSVQLSSWSCTVLFAESWSIWWAAATTSLVCSDCFWTGCSFKRLSVCVCAPFFFSFFKARCLITHGAPRCSALPCPASPPLLSARSGSLQSLSLLLFISAPLAGAQSELQPGNRAHTSPHLTARSPPLASAFLSLRCRQVSHSLPLVFSSFFLSFFLSLFLSFSLLFLYFCALNVRDWLDSSVSLLSCESLQEPFLSADWWRGSTSSSSSSSSSVHFQLLFYVFWYLNASFSFLSLILQDLILIFVCLFLQFAFFRLILAVFCFLFFFFFKAKGDFIFYCLSELRMRMLMMIFTHGTALDSVGTVFAGTDLSCESLLVCGCVFTVTHTHTHTHTPAAAARFTVGPDEADPEELTGRVCYSVTLSSASPWCVISADWLLWFFSSTHLNHNACWECAHHFVLLACSLHFKIFEKLWPNDLITDWSGWNEKLEESVNIQKKCDVFLVSFHGSSRIQTLQEWCIQVPEQRLT